MNDKKEITRTKHPNRYKTKDYLLEPTAAFTARYSAMVTPGPIDNFVASGKERINKRCAWDRQPYTKKEFEAWYSNGAAIWETAPHFASIEQFCEHMKTHKVQTCIPDVGSRASSATLFGLWVPGFLLLVDIHHLNGKLKSSRLAPDTSDYQRNVWKNALRIGYENQTMVLDYSTELVATPAEPLARLGRHHMEETLLDFLEILDGLIINYKPVPCPETRVKKNLLMQFLAVDTSKVCECMLMSDNRCTSFADVMITRRTSILE